MTDTLTWVAQLGTKFHPATELFPLTHGPEFDELVADIRKNGLQKPIVVDTTGAIIDGRNRYRACQKTGTKPTYTVHNGNPYRHVIETNLARHNLTSNERAMIAAHLADAHDRDPNGTLNKQDTRTLLTVGSASVYRAREIIRHAIPALKEAVTAGQVPLTTAARISALPTHQQELFLSRINVGEHHRRVDPSLVTTNQRKDRYRYIHAEPTLRRIGESFDALTIVLATAQGLDPAITPNEAARLRSDLARRAKAFRQLMNLLKERSG